MLKRIRIGLAIAFFLSVTLIFLDFTGTLQSVLGFTARMQILPAILGLNVGMIVLMTVLTAVLGRVYCSSICPLGVFQDVISRISGVFKKNRFKYSKPKTKTRYTIFGLTVVSIISGVSLAAILLDPYAFYGRIATSFFAPMYQYGNNMLAYFAGNYEVYDIYETSVKIPAMLVLAIASASLAAVALLSWRSGRTYCNTICPVGTLLGFVSKFSLFKHRIDQSKCNSCGLCALNCKASCIDPESHEIDYSRCVACFDCIGKCSNSAIEFKLPTKPATHTSSSPVSADAKNGSAAARRNFIAVTSLFAVAKAVNAQTMKVDGGFAEIGDKASPERATAIVPPGAQSISHLEKHCTACQLCVSNCPNSVLSAGENLTKLGQPVMSFENGYCRPECVRCSEVCPTGAIRKISNVEKSAVKIGTAVWIKEKCFAYAEGVNCNNCARHCPAGAIQIVAKTEDEPKSPKLIVVDSERCIGCGACENLCPSRPLSAIYVEGLERHRSI